jgi:hypothetical protein
MDGDAGSERETNRAGFGFEYVPERFRRRP